MAVHGVSRSTRDLDLFTVFAGILEPQTWQALQRAGLDVRVERGDSQDPLAGVVRVSAPPEHPIDVIVGRSAWQAEIPNRARLATIAGAEVPVASVADLVLLKLYAGGPQDAWDIEQLVVVPGGATVSAEVEARLDALPVECRRLWERIRRGERPSS